MSSIEKKTNLILGQGSLGYSLFQELKDIPQQSWLTWSKSGRNNSFYSGDLGHYPLESLPPFDTVVVILSPESRDEDCYIKLYEKVLPRFFKQLIAKRVIFVSSTVVYSPSNALWRDETSDVTAYHYRARALLTAERTLRYYFPNNHIILRLAGINNHDLEKAPRQQNTLSGKYCWSNFIKKSDIVPIISQLLDKSNITGTYNVCDDRQSFVEDAESLGKKVSNLKIKSVLNYDFNS